MCLRFFGLIFSYKSNLFVISDQIHSKHVNEWIWEKDVINQKKLF